MQTAVSCIRFHARRQGEFSDGRNRSCQPPTLFWILLVMLARRQMSENSENDDEVEGTVLPPSLQANRLLSIKRVFPKNTANRSTEFALTTSTGCSVSA